MPTSLEFPLNDVQVSLLRLTEKLPNEELLALQKLIIAFKAQRLAALADKVWEEKGWSQETMQAFLETHMRTPYQSFNQQHKK